MTSKKDILQHCILHAEAYLEEYNTYAKGNKKSAMRKGLIGRLDVYLKILQTFKKDLTKEQLQQLKKKFPKTF